MKFTTIKEWKAFKALNENNSNKEELFDELEELLSDGEKKEATDIWDSLSDEDKEAYIDYRYDAFTDFSNVSNWENGVAPTRDEVKDDLLYLIDLGRNIKDTTNLDYSNTEANLSSFVTDMQEFEKIKAEKDYNALYYFLLSNYIPSKFTEVLPEGGSLQGFTKYLVGSDVNENYKITNLNAGLVDKLTKLGFTKENLAGYENLYDVHSLNINDIIITVAITGGQNYKLDKDSALTVMITDENGGQDITLFNDDASEYLANIEANIEKIKNQTNLNTIEYDELLDLLIDLHNAGESIEMRHLNHLKTISDNWEVLAEMLEDSENVDYKLNIQLLETNLDLDDVKKAIKYLNQHKGPKHVIEKNITKWNKYKSINENVSNEVTYTISDIESALLKFKKTLEKYLNLRMVDDDLKNRSLELLNEIIEKSKEDNTVLQLFGKWLIGVGSTLVLQEILRHTSYKGNGNTQEQLLDFNSFTTLDSVNMYNKNNQPIYATLREILTSFNKDIEKASHDTHDIVSAYEEVIANYKKDYPDYADEIDAEFKRKSDELEKEINNTKANENAPGTAAKFSEDELNKISLALGVEKVQISEADLPIFGGGEFTLLKHSNGVIEILRYDDLTSEFKEFKTYENLEALLEDLKDNKFQNESASTMTTKSLFEFKSIENMYDDQKEYIIYDLKNILELLEITDDLTSDQLQMFTEEDALLQGCQTQLFKFKSMLKALYPLVLAEDGQMVYDFNGVKVWLEDKGANFTLFINKKDIEKFDIELNNLVNVN